MNVIKMLDRPIAFQRALLDVVGRKVTAALLLSQAIFWQNHSPSEDGWWWKTAKQWEEETGLSQHELESARRACSEILMHKKAGVPCRSWYKIDEEKLMLSLAKSAKLDLRKPLNKLSEKREAANICTNINQKEHTPAAQFADMWSGAYKEFFGVRAASISAHQLKQIEELLSRGYSKELLLDVVRRAWKMKNTKAGFNCRRAVSLKGFLDKFDEIKDETDQSNREVNPRNVGLSETSASKSAEIVAALARRNGARAA
jgi:hypothetical protein